MDEILTPEQVAGHYSAAMDSVDLINAGKPESMDEAQWVDCLKRNVGHLEIMVAKDFMQTQALTPLQEAITTGKAQIPA